MEVVDLFAKAGPLAKILLIIMTLAFLFSSYYRIALCRKLEQMLNQQRSNQISFPSKAQTCFEESQLSFSQEKLGRFNLLWLDAATRNFPNIILVAGLIITLLAIINGFSGIASILSQEGQIDLKEFRPSLNQISEAFLGSFVAVFLSTVLSIINLFWNSKNLIDEYFACLEAASARRDPMVDLIDRMEQSFNRSIEKFAEAVQRSVDESIGKNLDSLTKINEGFAASAKKIFDEFELTSGKMKEASSAFSQAAESLKYNNFPDRLKDAVQELERKSETLIRLMAVTENLENAVQAVNQTLAMIQTQYDVLNNTQVSIVNLVKIAKEQQKVTSTSTTELKREIEVFSATSSRFQEQMATVSISLNQLKAVIIDTSDAIVQANDRQTNQFTASTEQQLEQQKLVSELMAQQFEKIQEDFKNIMASTESIYRATAKFTEAAQATKPISEESLIQLTQRLQDNNRALDKLSERITKIPFFRN